MVQYTFGDSASAERRLRVLASVYEAESATFIQKHAPASAGLAIDLGCGPGHTTALLARVSGAKQVLGLDISEAFVAAARAEYGASAEFAVADITRSPITVEPADLIFARLLVTHLAQPDEAVRGWVAALGRDGRLLLDEVEAIDVTEPVCARYLAITAAVVKSSGGELYIGEALAAMAPAGATVVANETVPVEVPAVSAAAMFRLNLPNWSERAISARLSTRDELNEIAADLDQLADGRRAGPALRWHMRHMVIAPG